MRSAARIGSLPRDFRAAERARADQLHRELAELVDRARRAGAEWYVWLMARREARLSEKHAAAGLLDRRAGGHALLCRCGRWLHAHGSVLENSAGGRSYGACLETGCAKFRNAAGEGFIAGKLRPDSD